MNIPNVKSTAGSTKSKPAMVRRRFSVLRRLVDLASVVCIVAIKIDFQLLRAGDGQKTA
jgi:hypothetical protein